MTRGPLSLLWAIASIGVAVPGASALPPGSPAAREAFALCELAADGPLEARVNLLTRGLALAEVEAARDDHDALAQFALFCNLGRRVQTGGIGIGAGLDVLRAMRALDAALALAPDDADVVAAKGVLLMQLPRLLGGDPVEGEQWLRRALALDPRHGAARDHLGDDAASPDASTAPASETDAPPCSAAPLAAN